MSKQYIVFSGIGKTTWCKSHLNWVDLDVGWFDPHFDSHAVSSLFYFYPRWDYNCLISGTEETIKFINYHKNNWENLTRPKYRQLEINIIIPSFEMKEEILTRITKRGCNKDTEYLISVYDKNWKALDEYQNFDTKVYLKPGQYLSDIIDENGEYKPGIDVIYGH